MIEKSVFPAEGVDRGPAALLQGLFQARDQVGLAQAGGRRFDNGIRCKALNEIIPGRPPGRRNLEQQEKNQGDGATAVQAIPASLRAPRIHIQPAFA